MSSLLNIKSIYNLKLIFEFTGEKRKLNLFKLNEKLQNKLDIHIYDYKKLFFTKDIPEINKDNLLNFYDYLKRKYKDEYTKYDLKNFFAEFFCNFINEKKIDFELNSSHEVAIDVLLSKNLKSIKLIMDLNDYKSSYKSKTIKDKNKISYLPLFQTIFDSKIIKKISQIIIKAKDIKEIDINKEKENIFFYSLAKNIYKFKPKVKTDIINIYMAINDYILQLNNYEGKDDEVFKLWELDVPPKDNYEYGFEDILPKINLNVNLDRPFNKEGNSNIEDDFIIESDKSDDSDDSFFLDLISDYKIRNYFIKLNYKDLLSFKDDLSNVKKLELIMKGDIINIQKFEKALNDLESKIDKDNEKKIEEIKNKYNVNNFKYIQYFNEFYAYYKIYDNGREAQLILLKYLKLSEFEELNIVITKNYINYSINKLTNSIEFYLIFYNPEKTEFFTEIGKFEKVKLKIKRAKNDENQKEYNLLKYDEDSKIKHFELEILIIDSIYKYHLDFPLNFKNLISLDLAYTLVLDENTHINFPLTEKNNKYDFPNLKNLKINFFYDCEYCKKNSPKELIKNLSDNLKFCPKLEILVIYYELFNKNPNELNLILNGIKRLKYLRSLNIYTKIEEKCIITTNEFYNIYPEFINYCPFLNDIKMEISEFLKYDFLYEKNINYKINDIVIDKYFYIETLGQKSSYSTYLCKNKDNKKVVIRKFKKSRIDNASDLFENEKYCLKKYKNSPNIINYIDFLSDEYFEYIVYEYIEDTLKKIKSKNISTKVCNILEKFYESAKKDKKIILLPILPTNILIKNNFDVVLTGFGYLNIYFDYSYKKDKLHNFYIKMKEYHEEIFSLIPMSNSYNDYINDIRKYYTLNNNWSYLLAKIKYKKLKIRNKIKFEKKLKIGKIIINKYNIFTLQENSLIIYDRKKFYKITEIRLHENEEENTKINSYDFILIDDNILIVLYNNKLYAVTFNNNQIKKENILSFVICNGLDKTKNKINFFEYRNIIYIEKKDLIFLSYKNTVFCFRFNKLEKKSTFVKVYSNLNSNDIFKLKNNSDIPLISIGNEKLIFYKINDKNELIPSFDYIHNIKNWSFYENKKFIQDNDYCYILLFNSIFIIRINYEQKQIDCLFSCCLGTYEIKYIFPSQNGIFLREKGDFYNNYLTKINGEYEIIKNRFKLENDKIYDIVKDENSGRLFIIGSESMIEI